MAFQSLVSSGDFNSVGHDCGVSVFFCRLSSFGTLATRRSLEPVDRFPRRGLHCDRWNVSPQTVLTLERCSGHREIRFVVSLSVFFVLGRRPAPPSGGGGGGGGRDSTLAVADEVVVVGFLRRTGGFARAFFDAITGGTTVDHRTVTATEPPTRPPHAPPSRLFPPTPSHSHPPPADDVDVKIRTLPTPPLRNDRAPRHVQLLLGLI